ncbi:MAG TPA: poly-beta-1,6-N-acetyl-D-glucosamine biosynthesis protein PgaD [Luteibacter sp.]|jgi:biofilm PGA synthesis protein PgaD|uniref:poly-beta-1,6-N-acetyl-D-glucosamine biosynthesis protein PgaD n=1 Tax=Luteibacter sp. TaxID=1886636 RepID=UPI002F40C95B
MKAEAIIIQRPERQSGAQKAMFGLVTVTLWVAWACLWLPLVTLGAWAYGIRDALTQLHLLDPITDGGDIYVVLGVAVVTAIIFTGWSMYNYARFVGKQKRRGNSPVGIAETAAKIGAHIDEAIRLQSTRRAVVSVADDGFMTVKEAR